MADKSLLELPLATTGAGALIYGVQDNVDKAFPASVLQGSENPQPANTVYAGPTATPGNFPTFRPLVANDIPDLSAIYMAASGGNLANATLNNSTILGGTISGATAVFDEDKFTLRDTTDTTRNGKFNVALPATATSVTWTLPATTATLVGRDTADTLTNKKIILDASTTATAALRITPGQPPSAPINGDLWTTNSGLFAQINNATVGPFAAAASSTVNSWNGRVGAVTMGSSDVTAALGYTPYNPAQGSYLPITGGTVTGTVRANSLRAGPAGQVYGSIHHGGGNIVWWNSNNAAGTLPLADAYYRAASHSFINGEGNIKGVITGTGASTWRGATTSVSDGTGAFRADCGSLGTQSAAFAILQNGSRQWAMGIDTDRSFKIWAYADNGNYIGERVNINRDGNMGLSAGLTVTGPSEAAYLVTRNGWIGSDNNHHIDLGKSGVRDTAFFQQIGGTWYFRNTANGVHCMDVTPGGVTASGGFGPGSDPRLKVTESLKVVDNAVNTLYNLNVRKGKYHDWYNSDGKDRYFVMADESMKHFAPEVVMKDAIERDDVKYDAWNSDQMIALLVKSVQELKDEIDTLKEKLNEYSH